GEEALREIVRVPQIEVADLRAFDGNDAKQMAGRHGEGARIARRHDGFGDFDEIAPDVVVECTVVRRELVDGVDDDRWRGATGGGVGRRGSFGMTSHPFS